MSPKMNIQKCEKFSDVICVLEGEYLKWYVNIYFCFIGYIMVHRDTINNLLFLW